MASRFQKCSKWGSRDFLRFPSSGKRFLTLFDVSAPLWASFPSSGKRFLTLFDVGAPLWASFAYPRKAIFDAIWRRCATQVTSHRILFSSLRPTWRTQGSLYVTLYALFFRCFSDICLRLEQIKGRNLNPCVCVCVFLNSILEVSMSLHSILYISTSLHSILEISTFWTHVGLKTCLFLGLNVKSCLFLGLIWKYLHLGSECADFYNWL